MSRCSRKNFDCNFEVLKTEISENMNRREVYHQRQYLFVKSDRDDDAKHTAIHGHRFSSE